MQQTYTGFRCPRSKLRGNLFDNKVASFFAIILSVFFVVTAAQAASTISTNIQTDGTLSVTGISSFTGNVGILNASPTYNFDVTGLGHFTGLVDAANFVATSTTATSTFAGGLAVRTSGLVYDFQTGNVGINTASPAAKLDVTSSGSALLNLESSATFNQLTMTSYRNSASTHNNIDGYAARGSKASPSAVQNGDNLISIRANGYGTTRFEDTVDDSASIDLAADETFTDNAAGGKIVFRTRQNGSINNTLSGRMVINNIGQVGIGLGVAPTLTASLTVATTTNAATTTVEIGRSGQNKGTCLALYDVTGAAVYVTVQGGALVVSGSSCK